MNSGDAAEQVVRMSLEGVEVAAKIAGSAAREAAAFLMAALKSDDGKKEGGEPLKLRGKERLASMLKSGKPLEIFSVPEGDLQAFYRGAKQYGIVYCVLKQNGHSADGLCDVMVRAEDAPRVNRLVERLKLATVSRAAIEREVVSERAEPAASKPAVTTAEVADTADAADTPEINDIEQLLNDVFGEDKDKAAPEAAGADAPDAPPDPNHSRPSRGAMAQNGAASRDSPPLSEPTSSGERTSARRNISKPSVSRELDAITAAHERRGADGGRTRRSTSITHMPLMPEDGGEKPPVSREAGGIAAERERRDADRRREDERRRGADGGRARRSTSITRIPLMPEDGGERAAFTKSESRERS